jgi:hypothetical protein
MSSSQFQNGRVIMNNTQNVKDMNMIEGNKPNNNFQVESLYGIQETSKLNQLFFSKKNMDIIQNNIRYTVYVKTNKRHIIDKQSDIELQIIMRSTYLQYSPNLEYNYKEQLEYLNKLVVDWSVEQIIPQLEQYIGYLKEVEYMPMPIDLPVNLSSKGSRTLRSVTSTF